MVSGGKTTATTSSSNTTTTSHKPSSSSSSSTSSRSHASSTAAAAKPPLESSDDYSSEEDDVVSASNVRRSYDASYQLVGVSDASLTSSSASISSVTSSLTSSLVLEGGSDTSSSSGGSGSSSTSSKAVRSHGFKHYDRPSLLSSEASANSYRGLINLLVILLFVTNFRLVVENALKYGSLLSMPQRPDWHRWPATTITLGMNVFILLAVGIEKIAAKQWISSGTALKLAFLNVAATMFAPCAAVIMWRPIALGSSMTVMTLMTITMMKLFSYAHINYIYREKFLKKQRRRLAAVSSPTMRSKSNAPPATPRNFSIVGGDLVYPFNISISNMYMFLCLPTLVYQLSYPRSNRPIHWAYVGRRVAELIFFSALALLIVEQYILPLLTNALPPLEANNVPLILERLLKLAIPNLYVWLLGFYCFFHLWLNIVAELLHFADRKFYGDWWNATSLAQFWRNWNLPVHHWIAVHVFKPSMELGLSQTGAFMLSFFISAVFHEVIISVPFRAFRLWAFWGMVMQVPLVYLTKSLQGNQIGNVIFWVSISLGQPFSVLMYYKDFILLQAAEA